MGANNKKTYHRRKNEGACPNCGSIKIMEGKTYCKRCSKEISELNKIRRDERIKNGKCGTCGGNKSYRDMKKDGSYYKNCFHCRLLKNAYETKWKEGRK